MESPERPVNNPLATEICELSSTKKLNFYVHN